MRSHQIRFVHTLAVALALGVSSAGVALAQPAVAPRIDDAFTWFTLSDNPRLGSNPRNEGWRLSADVRWIGQSGASDAIKLVVRQGTRTLGRARCEPSPTVTEVSACGATVTHWIGGVPMLTVTGEVLVDVLHVNGVTDTETPLRTYRIRVDQVTRVNEGNFSPLPPLYYVDGSARVGSAVLRSHPPSTSEAGTLELHSVVSTTDTAGALTSARSSLRCSVDGQPLTIGRDQVSGRTFQSVSVVGTSRPRTGNELDRRLRDWRQIVWALPVVHGPGRRSEGDVSLDEHPGTWLCEIRQNGQTLRTFRFTARSGVVQAHAEEASGLSLDPRDHLVEYWIPGAALANDQPLDTAAIRAGGFYGHAWVSPAARDNVANLARAPAFTTAGASAPVAGAAASVRYDEGYTWFQAQNTIEPVNGSPRNLGWNLAANLRAYGTAGQRSTFRLVLKQGTRGLGEVRCPARPSGVVSMTYVYADDCGTRPSEQVSAPMRLSATGPIQVEVRFVDGVTEQDSLLRTHTLQILQATGIRGNGEPDAPNYYVNRNAETVTSLIEAAAAPVLPGVTGASSGHVGISFYMSPTEAATGQVLQGHQIRCRVDDQPVTLPNAQLYGVAANEEAVTHTRPDPASSANPIREPVIYRRYYAALALGVGAPNSALLPIREHPGAWVCDLRQNGQTFRTFRWTVQRDGTIAAHPEDASLSLAPGVHMIETVVPQDGGMDARTDPAAVRAGGFYGHAWVSPQMRAVAGAVPAIGRPAPPQPAAGRAAAASTGSTGGRPGRASRRRR